MVEAGGDKDPPTTITTGATSAAALTTMNILPDSQQNIKGEIRKLMGFLEIFWDFGLCAALAVSILDFVIQK